MSENAIVHIIDDDESLCDALGRLLRSVGIEARAYGSVQQFLDAQAQGDPGCIVLDVRLPGISGLDFQSQLAELGIHLPVVLMTGHGDVPMSVRAMKAGAVDFLPKPFRDQDMLDAVTRALDQDRKRRDEEKAVSQLRHLLESLTRREREVLPLVISGLMNKQIAHRLEISEITVKIHRGQVMKKMQARSLADLVRTAEMLGIKRTN